MIKIHFSRPQRGASGAAPLAVRRIGRFPFMILQNPEKRPRELVVPLGSNLPSDRLDRRNKAQGRGQFVGRAALPAFSAAGCAFEGQDPAQLGSLPATSESTISFSAAAGDALQSRRSRRPRGRASCTTDRLTWRPVKLQPAVLRHCGKP